MNPDIRDVNHIVPGQRIKIPEGLKSKEKPAAQKKSMEQPSLLPPVEKKPAQAEIKPDIQQKNPELPKVSQIAAVEEAPRNKEPLKPKASQPVPPPPAAVPEKVIPAVQPSKTSMTQAQTPKTAAQVMQRPAAVAPAAVSEPQSNAASSNEKAQVSRLIKSSLVPAFKQMGASSRDQGKYYMPVAGGNIAIDASEIPVLELDNGKKIILDLNGRISPKVSQLIEKTFPDCRIISSPGADLEAAMDKVLSVSGYFSINKSGDPVIIGSDEKLKFSGKWIVYKDFTRSNVYVINILNEDQVRTPGTLAKYALRFGLDIIEIGGRDAAPEKEAKPAVYLKKSYKALFDALSIRYRENVDIKLLDDEPVMVTFKAPLLVGMNILAKEMPQEEIRAMLSQKGYRIFDAEKTEPFEVLGSLNIKHEGPPLKLVVAEKRAEIEVPGVRIGDRIILEKSLNQDIILYLISTGMQVVIW